MQLHDFDTGAFLRDYWQKRPLLIRNPWQSWRNPIDPDELAGLACEEGVESRLISRGNEALEAEDGPFPETRFGKLGPTSWTLLVQAVDHHVPEVAALIEPFRFVPNWRIDDVMVSTASDGGGVGAHFDHYDVFLVQGLGHCNACHGSRNALGATGGTLDLGGGLIPMQNWYAPSLSDPHEAGVAEWPQQQVADLLKNGVNAQASVLGPMAEVVGRSTQHLSDADLRAVATYLQGLPPTRSERVTQPAADSVALDRGAKLYAQHCADCHGDKGEGVAGVYPALAGNRAVTLASPANLVRVVLEGGFAPSTAGNPRPYGMPPFATVLDSADTAAVLSYVRSAWGNQGAAVPEIEVNRYR